MSRAAPMKNSAMDNRTRMPKVQYRMDCQRFGFSEMSFFSSRTIVKYTTISSIMDRTKIETLPFMSQMNWPTIIVA